MPSKADSSRRLGAGVVGSGAADRAAAQSRCGAIVSAARSIPASHSNHPGTHVTRLRRHCDTGHSADCPVGLRCAERRVVYCDMERTATWSPSGAEEISFFGPQFSRYSDMGFDRSDFFLLS